MACRYFPECFDGEECLYEHNTAENTGNVCPNGEKCSDQTCLFNEQQHKSPQQMFCRFQLRCNRSGCPYKHSTTRRAFLGESFLGKRKL